MKFENQKIKKAEIAKALIVFCRSEIFSTEGLDQIMVPARCEAGVQ